MLVLHSRSDTANRTAWSPGPGRVGDLHQDKILRYHTMHNFLDDKRKCFVSTLLVRKPAEDRIWSWSAEWGSLKFVLVSVNSELMIRHLIQTYLQKDSLILVLEISCGIITEFKAI